MQTSLHLIKSVFCLLLLSRVVYAIEVQPVFIIKDINGILLTQPGSLNFTLMSSDDRLDVLRRLRAELDDSVHATRDRAGHSLLFLDDEDGIAHLVKNYREGDIIAESNLSNFAADGDVVLIPYLIDDLYNGPTEIRAGGDFSTASIRDTSVGMIYSSIERSSFFPVETRLWLKEIFALSSLRDAALSQLKDWWEHNKEAILARQYDKAIWLPAEKLSLNPPTTTTQISPKSGAPSQLPINPSPPPDSTSPIRWLVGVAAIIAAITLGFRFLRRP